MLQKILSDFLSSQGIPLRSSFLVAVSGGPDSMAMLHASKSLGLDIRAAHCNFSLRGEESDMDEEFVIHFCRTHGIPYSLVRFDTRSHAAAKGLSIEMAARELRYAWFKETKEKYGIGYTLVAHHADDLAETCLINLCRGTGIKGLGGIRAVNGDILRPFLDCPRADILRYLEENGLEYRTDSTNSSDEFVRNRIRNRIIPECKTINPSFLQTMKANCEAMRETEAIFRYGISILGKEILEKRGTETCIHIGRTMDSPAPYTFLYETLKPYGFNKVQIREILASSGAVPGRQFISASHILTKDREYWRLFPRTADGSDTQTIGGCGEYFIKGRHYSITTVEPDPEFRIPADPETACLDADKVRFPLEMRKWQPGDFFCPFGMKGRRKKISDFFAGLKFSSREKDECRLLCSGKDIVWVWGIRPDERFKVTPETKKILIIKPL